jgi:7,8-dihydropterin-6-yl-methyl-4-(beta-D-ribofuranosyl)aminobenzene 5'-phosphate synthase
MRLLKYVILCVLIFSAIATGGEGIDMPVIKICYDNISVKKGIVPAHGFACVIKWGSKNILFDTGGKADVLLANMKAMRVSPEAVTDIFISHSHWDHTGGLFGFLSKNHKVKVYVPASFSRAYRNEINASGAECISINNFTKIAEEIYSSGEMGQEIKEQFLIIVTPSGLIMITGCSHPGIVRMAGLAKKKLNKDILLIVGGFHLGNLPIKEAGKIVEQLKRLGVKNIAPCHCTGAKAIRAFKQAFQVGYVGVGAGSIIDTAMIK